MVGIIKVLSDKKLYELKEVDISKFATELNCSELQAIPLNSNYLIYRSKMFSRSKQAFITNVGKFDRLISGNFIIVKINKEDCGFDDLAFFEGHIRFI